MDKMTYSKALEIVLVANAKAKAEGSALYSDEVVEKLVALQSSIDKKNGKERKPTTKQKENDILVNAILDYMQVGTPYTISTLQKSVPALKADETISNQRVSALVHKLADAKLVTRTEIKRVAYFTKVADLGEDEGEDENVEGEI